MFALSLFTPKINKMEISERPPPLPRKTLLMTWHAEHVLANQRPGRQYFISNRNKTFSGQVEEHFRQV